MHAVPNTPARHFAKGKSDPAFRTKLQIGAELAVRAREAGFAFRAVAAGTYLTLCRPDHQRPAHPPGQVIAPCWSASLTRGSAGLRATGPTSTGPTRRCPWR